jgi:hypothetical protein
MKPGEWSLCWPCSPYRDRPRTLDAMLEKLMAWFIANPTASFEVGSTFQDKDSKGDTEPKNGTLAA